MRDGRALRHPGARHRRERCRVLGGEAVLCLWARQCADVSAGGRRDQRADGGAADAGGGQPRAAASTGRRSFSGFRPFTMRCSPATDLPQRDELALRRCVSAGEPLPQEIGRRWSARIGVDILDGIGSTEMLHIFLSNWPGAVRYGTTGRPIPGYQLKIVDEEERPGPPRRNRRPVGQRTDQRRLLLEQSRALPDDVHGPVDPHRRQIFRRRGRLLRLLRPQRRHDEGQRHVRLAGRGRGGARRARGRARSRRRRRAGRERSDQAEGVCRRETRLRADEELARASRAPCRRLLAPFKCPRWYAFLDDLPKTATGKIQRFKLREPSP